MTQILFQSGALFDVDEIGNFKRLKEGHVHGESPVLQRFLEILEALTGYRLSV